jgi:hypothetical protein
LVSASSDREPFGGLPIAQGADHRAAGAAAVDDAGAPKHPDRLGQMRELEPGLFRQFTLTKLSSH